MSDQAEVKLRPGKKDDRNFILSSWLQTQYFSSPFWSQVPQDLFYIQYAQKINKILDSPSTRVDVAVSFTPNELIHGYVVSTQGTVYWVYVKKDYRGKGILNLMLKNLDVNMTASTTLAGASIAKKKKLTFNPFLIPGG